jgi:hypothetical protein
MFGQRVQGVDENQAQPEGFYMLLIAHMLIQVPPLNMLFALVSFRTRANDTASWLEVRHALQLGHHNLGHGCDVE